MEMIRKKKQSTRDTEGKGERERDKERQKFALANETNVG